MTHPTEKTCPDCKGTGSLVTAIEPSPEHHGKSTGAVTCARCGGRGTIRPDSKAATAAPSPPSLTLGEPTTALEARKGEIAASIQAKLDDEADDVGAAAAKLSGEAADYAALSAQRSESAADHAEAAAVAAAASAGVAEQAAATIAALSSDPQRVEGGHAAVAPDDRTDTLPKTTWTCPHCGAENQPDAAPTCGRCGKDWSAEPDAPGAESPEAPPATDE